MGIIKECLQDEPVIASAPCRLDMGGTLDLSTFYLFLQNHLPCTFNAALDMRTHVSLKAHNNENILISSKGFEPIEMPLESAPFNHPVGLLLAVASHFQAKGVHIQITSTSPPRSSLGGSSAATVALIWAFYKSLSKAGRSMPSQNEVALLAHAIEQSVAGVVCGMQDFLSAAFGGMNTWRWIGASSGSFFSQQRYTLDQGKEFSKRILVAYCGRPHVSKDINSTWIQGFVGGRDRNVWKDITRLSNAFVVSLDNGDYEQAQQAMNDETRLRVKLTPQVLDDVGNRLFTAAVDQDCGVRFTGAGGGGCVWALGANEKQIESLVPEWLSILSQEEHAGLLDTGIDAEGVL